MCVFLYLPLFPCTICSVVKRCAPKWPNHKRVAATATAGCKLVAHLNVARFHCHTWVWQGARGVRRGGRKELASWFYGQMNFTQAKYTFWPGL